MTVMPSSGVEQARTFHPDVGRLLLLWNRWRGDRKAPFRSDVKLQELSVVLPYTMVLERSPVQPLFTMRLAGTALRRFTGRELTGSDFSRLWAVSDREMVTKVLSRTISELGCQIFSVEGVTATGHQAAFQCVFLPVRVDGRQTVQVLGCLLPLNEPYWYDKHPITLFHLLSAQTLDREPFGEVERLASRG